MNMYIWRRDSWPRMNWNSTELILPLGRTMLAQDELIAKAERLKGWQAALFPSGYSGIHRIITGN